MAINSFSKLQDRLAIRVRKTSRPSAANARNFGIIIRFIMAVSINFYNRSSLLSEWGKMLLTELPNRQTLIIRFVFSRRVCGRKMLEAFGSSRGGQ